MIPRLKSRFPLFEAAILLGMLGVGWAMLRTYGALREVAQRPPEPPPRVEARTILRLHGVMEIRDRYQSISGQIGDSLREMKMGLQDYVTNRSPAGLERYVHQSRMLLERLAVQAGGVDPQSVRAVWDWISALPALGADETLKSDVALDVWSREAAAAASNYVAAIGVGSLEGFNPEIVKARLARATDAEDKLAALVPEGRQRAVRLDGLVTRRTEELAVLMQPVPSGDNGRAESERTLRLILYGLGLAFLLQAVVVMAAFYRRLVVIPLQQRIIEHNAAADFQRKLDHFARLATGLAHEIRNPLTAINIRLFTLQKSLAGRSAEHEDTVLIRGEIDRLEQILKNFLKLARPSEPKFVSMTAEPLLTETRSLLADQCWRRGVELKLDDVCPTPFLGDPVQLKQVLINLVQNAAESIDGQGMITLRARDREVRLGDRLERVVVLEVEDTGCGISPEVQERLFDPFFSTKDHGTGLGLPIAAKIVDQHKGKLEFESPPKGGTVFRVSLSANGRIQTNV